MPCLKYYPRNLRKYEIKETSKIPISQLLSEFGKIWTYCLGLYSKNPIFHLLLELGTNEKSIKSNIQKSQNFFVSWQKLGTLA